MTEVVGIILNGGENRVVDGVSHVQHDASINSGNSGGGLFTLDGKLIGINTLKIVAENIETRPYFENKAPGELIFTDKEINNDLNFHKLRALSAQEFYNISLNRLMTEPDFEKQMLDEIQRRWDKYNLNKETGKPKPFIPDKFKGWYVTRGSVRKAAQENNKPIKYNRLCALYTSLMKLSHFRLNVCIENYLVCDTSI